VAPSFAAKWLVPRLDRFHEEHPEVEVWISADMELADLSEGAIDMAVRYGPGDYPNLIAEKLIEETVLPVCSPALLAGSDPLRRPEDLTRHVLLHDASPADDPSCPDWPMWLKARGVLGVDPRRGPRFNQSVLAIEAAASGRGVALAKRSIASADLESGRLAAPFADGATAIDFAYHLVLPRDRPVSPAATAFIHWLRREARDYQNNMDRL
jgi:LysR family glycine cleavage system transcriptional activator